MNFIEQKMGTHSFYQMVMWDLREEVMYHMRSYVVVDVVYPTVIAVKSCEAPSQITPFLFYQIRNNN